MRHKTWVLTWFPATKKSVKVQKKNHGFSQKVTFWYLFRFGSLPPWYKINTDTNHPSSLSSSLRLFCPCPCPWVGACMCPLSTTFLGWKTKTHSTETSGRPCGTSALPRSPCSKEFAQSVSKRVGARRLYFFPRCFLVFLELVVTFVLPGIFSGQSNDQSEPLKGIQCACVWFEKNGSNYLWFFFLALKCPASRAICRCARWPPSMTSKNSCCLSQRVPTNTWNGL